MFGSCMCRYQHHGIQISELGITILARTTFKQRLEATIVSVITGDQTIFLKRIVGNTL